jgi:hypothetical protein
MQEIIERLLRSDEPAIRYKVRVNVLGEDPEALAVKRLRGRIRRSPRVQGLLSERRADGTIAHSVYSKWSGAHWVLPVLADLGYPSGDKSLVSLREQVCCTWLSPAHIERVPVIQGRARRCGSQEGNALWSLLRLGLDDERCDQFARNLMKWQWPDGGWNCDRNPPAAKSSFHETLIPLRALSLYGRVRKSPTARAAARRAAEVFLKRRLFRRQRDGKIMNSRFLKLHYPPYWHYDVLFALKVMAEAGFISDPRCAEALDLLESKRLPGGGFPAEAKWYAVLKKIKRGERRPSGRSLVDWGGVGARRMNEFVTVDALYVLAAAGRAKIN